MYGSVRVCAHAVVYRTLRIVWDRPLDVGHGDSNVAISIRIYEVQVLVCENVSVVCMYYLVHVLPGACYQGVYFT